MPKLSDPLEVKRLHLGNRLVMAPLVTGLAEAHTPSEAQLDWYARHARSGVGLVIVESTAIAPDALNVPRMLGLWEDAQIPGLAALARAIHAQGVPTVLQIVHSGAKSLRGADAGPLDAPSDVPLAPGPRPRPMAEAAIERAIAAFAASARRAREAGFDGVEIHGAHYYLISEFLSPRTNRREDHWGGSREGRIRLALEVVRAVRRTVGPDFSILFRLHAQEAVEGGLTTGEALLDAKDLEAAGVDLLDLSGIGHAEEKVIGGRSFLSTRSALPPSAPAGAFAPAAGRIRAALRIPVIAVGKLAEPGLAQRALDLGQADLVALGRALIADQEVPRKLLEGRDGEIRRCRECLACFAAIHRGTVRCTVNPAP